MNDTRPEAKKIREELFAKLSGEERLLMGLEMFVRRTPLEKQQEKLFSHHFPKTFLKTR